MFSSLQPNSSWSLLHSHLAVAALPSASSRALEKESVFVLFLILLTNIHQHLTLKLKQKKKKKTFPMSIIELQMSET